MVERIVRQLAAANENLTGNVLKTIDLMHNDVTW